MNKFVLITGFLLVVGSLFIFSTRIVNNPSDPTSSPLSQGSPSSVQSTSIWHGIFEGITPCSNTKRPLPTIPSNATCRLMIWRIEFNKDSTYLLSSSYGMPQQGTTGIIGGGIKITMRGKWSITRGINQDLQATVIKLSTEDSQVSISFLKVSDDIIHLLDNDKNLMVGNASWSYTLNRTNGIASESTLLPPTAKYASFLGVYEGRVPCVDIIYEFTKIPKNSTCDKIKLRLFLYQDPNTGNPTTYLFDGTSTQHEGTWVILRGTKTNPKAIVYQLNTEGSKPLYLLRVDENNLFILDKSLTPFVGDRLWSFTLSRTD